MTFRRALSMAFFCFFLDSSQLAGQLGFPLTLSGKETQTSQLKVFPPPPVSGFPLFWTNVSHAIALVISCFLKVPDGAWLTSKAICLLVYGTGASGTLCDRCCPLGSGWSPGVVTDVFCGPFSGYRLGLADLPWPTQAHSAGADVPRTVPECTVTVASAVGLTARPPGPP